MGKKFDVIIIGSGLGGLTAGAKLSKEGKRVLLLEQHYIPGGCATTFKRKDFTFEVGLHEMVGFNSTNIKTKIFNELDIQNNVKFVEIPEFYRFINDKYDIVIPHSPQEAAKILITKFPQDEKGINDFFFRLTEFRIKKNSPNFNNEITKNLGFFLDSIIKNEDLKLILLGNLGYFSDNPYNLSLMYYAASQGDYYKGGGIFIKGGSQKLSDYLAEFIQKNGGEIKYKHLVTEIITQNNKAIGVKYKKTGNTNTEIFKTYAKHIVANTAMPNVANLLPKEYGTELLNYTQKLEKGPSLLTVYFGFKRNLKELGNKNYSVFVYDNSVKTQKDIFANNKSDFSTKNFTFVDYGVIDSGLAPKGKSVGVICCMDYLSDWKNLDKEKYKAKKEEVAKIFIERLEKLIPGIKNEIEYYELATAKTVKRYTLNPEGSVYGFAQTPQKALIENLETIENLHFASAWGNFGGGLLGAIYSGYFSAVGILRTK